MTSNMKAVLTKLGLSETEARVYLSMLRIGADTVQHIAREARISRTAAYEIISALEKKGLASTYMEGKRKNFVAEDPDKLEGYFSQRVHDIQLELKTLGRILPEMRLLQGGGDKPRVRYYKGDEAVHALFRDLAQVEPDELLEFTNIDVVYGAVDPKILTEARHEIDYRKLKTRVLHRGELRNPAPHVAYRQLKGAWDFEGDIWIYGNRIAFVHFVGKIEAVIVDNQLFADTLRALFLTAWDAAAS